MCDVIAILAKYLSNSPELQIDCVFLLRIVANESFEIIREWRREEKKNMFVKFDECRQTIWSCVFIFDFHEIDADIDRERNALWNDYVKNVRRIYFYFWEGKWK